MSEATLSKSKSEKLQKLKESLWIYNEASSIIAHAEIRGMDCEKVFMVLKRFQELREQLAKDIESLDPKAFNDAEEAETDAAVGE